MIHDHSIFDAPRDPALDLAPYEIDLGPDFERITIRRAPPARDHLTGDEIGKLALAGVAIGTAIAFALDAHGAAAALLSIVGL